MTILEPGPPVVVSPAPAAPPVVVPPAEPELQVIHHRSRRRAPLVGAAAACLLAASVGIAAWSPWSTPTTSGGRAQTQPPSYVQLTAVTDHSVAFRWSSPLTDASVVGYEIVRNGVVGDLVAPVQSTYVATGLAAGRTYRFQVIAIYAHSMSVPSTSIVATTSS